MNNLRKNYGKAAAYPQKLNRLFPEEKICMISALADFVYPGDKKTTGDEIDKHLSDAAAVIGQMEMSESRLKLAPGLRELFSTLKAIFIRILIMTTILITVYMF